jgi:hypothetical protein
MSTDGADPRHPFVAKNGDRLEDMSSWDPERQVFILDRSRRALSQRPSGSVEKRRGNMATRDLRRPK